MAGFRRHRINSANERPGAETGSADRRPRARARRLLAIGACSVGLLGAGLAAGLLVGDEAGDTAGSRDPEGEAETLALNPLVSTDPPPEGVVVISGDEDGRRAHVTLDSMPPSGRALYELWLLDGVRGQLALGTFAVPSSGRAEVEVPVPVEPSGFTYLDVSREPLDGNPGHSGVSIMRAPTSAGAPPP